MSRRPPCVSGIACGDPFLWPYSATGFRRVPWWGGQRGAFDVRYTADELRATLHATSSPTTIAFSPCSKSSPTELRRGRVSARAMPARKWRRAYKPCGLRGGRRKVSHSVAGPPDGFPRRNGGGRGQLPTSVTVGRSRTRDRDRSSGARCSAAMPHEVFSECCRALAHLWRPAAKRRILDCGVLVGSGRLFVLRFRTGWGLVWSEARFSTRQSLPERSRFLTGAFNLIAGTLGVLALPSAGACGSSCEPPRYAIGSRFQVTVTEVPAESCASLTLAEGDTFEIVVDDFDTTSGPRECQASATTAPHWFGDAPVRECISATGFMSVSCDAEHDDPSCRWTLSASVGLNGTTDASGNVMEGATYRFGETVSGTASGCVAKSCTDDYTIRIEGLAQ